MRSVIFQYSAVGKRWEGEYAAQDFDGKARWVKIKLVEYTPLKQASSCFKSSNNV